MELKSESGGGTEDNNGGCQMQKAIIKSRVIHLVSEEGESYMYEANGRTPRRLPELISCDKDVRNQKFIISRGAIKWKN